MVDPRARAVAVRAAELALALGVELSDDLALWSLAGGRPDAGPVPGRPEDLGELLEASIQPHDRHHRGAHYTPEELAADLVERALIGHVGPTICDPSCGGGSLLLAAGRQQVASGASAREVVTRLWGIDIDPLAVATTQAALALWSGTTPPRLNFVVADMLVAPPDLPSFDVVIGNPPFLSQLGVSTARSASESMLLKERFGNAVLAYTDPAALFLLAACTLTRRGGTVAMVQPQAVLAARDAAGVRAAVNEVADLREVMVPPGRPFEASVEVCVPILDVGPSTSETVPWSAHLARALGVPRADLRAEGTIGDEATTGAAFRTEYYGLVPHVHEASSRPDGRPLLTTGLVDLAAHSWGERPARIGGRVWQRPVVDVPSLEGRAAAWVARTSTPKLIIATQTRVVEATVDLDGQFVPGVPLVVAWASADRLWALAAALCSPPVTAWVAERTAGSALASRALKLTAALVRQVPLPADRGAWRVGTAALRAGELERYAEAMTAAYGNPSGVLAWWMDRL